MAIECTLLCHLSACKLLGHPGTVREKRYQSDSRLRLDATIILMIVIADDCDLIFSHVSTHTNDLRSIMQYLDRLLILWEDIVATCTLTNDSNQEWETGREIEGAIALSLKVYSVCGARHLCTNLWTRRSINQSLLYHICLIMLCYCEITISVGIRNRSLLLTTTTRTGNTAG